MLDAKKVVIFIKRNSLLVSEIHSTVNPTLENSQVFPWTDATLGQVFQQIKNNYGNNVRLLLDEDLVSVVCVTLPKNISNVQKEIQLHVQKDISINLDETSWDYKELLQIEDAKKGLQVIYQVAAVVHTYYETIATAIADSRLVVEFTEPLSYTLAYQIRNKVDPVVLLYKSPDSCTLLSVIHRGLVVISQVIDSKKQVESIENIITISKNKFSLIPTTLYLVGDLPSISSDQFTHAMLKVEVKDINPLIALAQMNEVHKRHERIRNVELTGYKKLKQEVINLPAIAITAVEQPNVSLQNEFLRKPTKPPILPKVILGILISVIVGLIGAIGYWSYEIVTDGKEVSSNKKINPPEPSQQSESKPQPTIESSESVDKKAFSIRVLNGSGVAGEAKKMNDFLVAEGFTVSDTGNADNSNYEETEIQSSGTEQSDFIGELKKTLDKNYTSMKVTEDASGSANLVIVIIGKDSL